MERKKFEAFLSQDEENYLHAYKQTRWNIVALTVIIVCAVAFQYLLFYFYLLPLYLRPLLVNRELTDYFRKSFLVSASFSVIWVVLLIGVLIAGFVSASKVTRIYKKLLGEYQTENPSGID